KLTAQPAWHILADNGVFARDGDPWARPMGRDVAAVDRTLAGEAREVAHRPRILGVLGGKLRNPAPDEQLWHLAIVQVRADCESVLGSDAVEDGQNLVLL